MSYMYRVVIRPTVNKRFLTLSVAVFVPHHRLYQVLAEEIEHTPRDHQSLQLLVEITSYLGDWHAGCGVVARKVLEQIP